MLALVCDMFFKFGIDSDKAAKIDAARISARWNLRRQPIPRKWKNVREVLFVGYGRLVLYRRPYRDSFVFAYRKVTWRSHRKYDRRVRDDGISVRRQNKRAPRTNPKNLPTRGDAERCERLDLGAERREGSLETERGWRSTANRYAYLPTYMRGQTVSPYWTGKAEILEFSLLRLRFNSYDYDLYLMRYISHCYVLNCN